MRIAQKNKKISNETKQKISKATKRGNNANAKKVICDNIIFECQTDCSEYYGIKQQTMSRWLTGKIPMPQKFIDLGLRYLDDPAIIYESQKGFKDINGKRIICNNCIFHSIVKCAKYYNVNRATMNYWLLHLTSMPQKYIDLGLRYYNPEVDGDIEQYEQYIVS